MTGPHPRLQCALFVIVATSAFAHPDAAELVPLAAGNGSQLVRAHCGGCHSLRLVTANRASRDGWLHMIRWMQKKQNLWPLDAETEDTILGYLATYYAADYAADYARIEQPRRPPLAAHLLPPTPNR